MVEKQHYLSFLLRVWQAGDGGQPQWYASLEDTRTGERTGFSSLEALFEYVKQQTRPESGQKEALQKG